MIGEFDNVNLSVIDRERLVRRFGESVTADYVERLSAWLTNTRKRRTNHYACILTWIRKDKTVEIKSQVPVAPLLDEAALVVKAEAIIRQRQRELEWWELDAAKHQHVARCEFGCQWWLNRRPVVPEVEQLVRKLREGL